MRVGVRLGDSPTVHGIGAVLGWLEGHGGGHVGHQLHVGHGNLGVGVGTAGVDLHLNSAAGCKLLTEAAVCGGRGVVHQNCTFAHLDGIVERQRRLCGLFIGDSQRRTVVATTTPRRRPSLTDNLRAAGTPCVVRSAFETQPDVLISQACHGSACRRMGWYRYDRHQCQNHNGSQQQRQESFGNSFDHSHFLLFSLDFPDLISAFTAVPIIRASTAHMCDRWNTICVSASRKNSFTNRNIP